MNRHDVFIAVLLLMLVIITTFTTCVVFAIHQASGEIPI